ncbi:hypothetical protein BJ742DRAFT_746177 [Cladochytrium replicatum]|nr:hypothetical protein BJ742DRAFT_746177 [Cladochytrium replicatum]
MSTRQCLGTLFCTAISLSMTLKIASCCVFACSVFGAGKYMFTKHTSPVSVQNQKTEETLALVKPVQPAHATFGIVLAYLCAQSSVSHCNHHVPDEEPIAYWCSGATPATISRMMNLKIFTNNHRFSYYFDTHEKLLGHNVRPAAVQTTRLLAGKRQQQHCLPADGTVQAAACSRKAASTIATAALPRVAGEVRQADLVDAGLENNAGNCFRPWALVWLLQQLTNGAPQMFD